MSLELLIIILILLWALGFFAFPVGNLIHVLIVIAIVLLILRLARGQGVP